MLLIDMGDRRVRSHVCDRRDRRDAATHLLVTAEFGSYPHPQLVIGPSNPSRPTSPNEALLGRRSDQSGRHMHDGAGPNALFEWMSSGGKRYAARGLGRQGVGRRGVGCGRA